MEGKVYIIDEDTLAIDKFGYDGDGFGVYIHVATKVNKIFCRKKIRKISLHKTSKYYQEYTLWTDEE